MVLSVSLVASLTSTMIFDLLFLFVCFRFFFFFEKGYGRMAEKGCGGDVIKTAYCNFTNKHGER